MEKGAIPFDNRFGITGPGRYFLNATEPPCGDYLHCRDPDPKVLQEKEGMFNIPRAGV